MIQVKLFEEEYPEAANFLMDLYKDSAQYIGELRINKYEPCYFPGWLQRWFYHQLPERNDPCPCDESNIKYKKCHIGKQLDPSWYI